MSNCRFGIAGACSLSSLGELADVIERGERAGFTSLLANDHLDSQLAPIPTLSAAAALSPTMLLGTLVAANDFRHPLMLAKEAATLDRLSGHRVELGIGAGWADDDYRQLGVPKLSASARIERLAAAIEILRLAWRGDTFSYRSTHYQLEDARGLPVIEEPIPVCLGGGGKRVLTLAGAVADIVGINLNFAAGNPGRATTSNGTAALTRQRVSWASQAAADAGRSIELQVRVHVAAVTTGADYSRLAKYLSETLGLSPDELAASPHNLIGSTDQIVEKIAGYADDLDLTYWVIPHEAIDSFAPVISQLA